MASRACHTPAGPSLPGHRSGRARSICTSATPLVKGWLSRGFGEKPAYTQETSPTPWSPTPQCCLLVDDQGARRPALVPVRGGEEDLVAACARGKDLEAGGR